MSDNNQSQPTENASTEVISPTYYLRWIALSLLIFSGALYLSYQLGFNENLSKVNRLNQQLNQQQNVSSLQDIVEDFQQLSQDLKLSSKEKSRLTELLDQVLMYKSDIDDAQRELKDLRASSSQMAERYQQQINLLKSQNGELAKQIDEFELAMNYRQGTVKSFTLAVNDSFSMLNEPTSRIGLEQIINNGNSAQLNVGNALMFFHIGRTLRFRFAPNWLCDITMVRIDNNLQRAEFEYSCQLN